MQIESLCENLSKSGASSRHLKILYLIYTTVVGGVVLHQRDLLQLIFIVIYSILYHTHSKWRRTKKMLSKQRIRWDLQSFTLILTQSSDTSSSSSPASTIRPSIYIQPPITNSTGSPIGIVLTAVEEGDRTNAESVRHNLGDQGRGDGITAPHPDSSAIPCTSSPSFPASSFRPSIYIQPPTTNNTGSPIGIVLTAGISDSEIFESKGFSRT